MKQPTADQKRLWNALSELGCIVGPSAMCLGHTTIHHCGTGAGGRKNHDYVIPLCVNHHTGPEGIDGGVMSKKQWQLKYWPEHFLWLKAMAQIKASAFAFTDYNYLKKLVGEKP